MQSNNLTTEKTLTTPNKCKNKNLDVKHFDNLKEESLAQ